MFAAFLALFAGMTPADEAAVALALARAARERQAIVVPVKAASPYIFGWHKLQPSERAYPGYHWHNDGEWWVQHGPENNGNARAHTSPRGNVKFNQSAAPCPH